MAYSCIQLVIYFTLYIKYYMYMYMLYILLLKRHKGANKYNYQQQMFKIVSTINATQIADLIINKTQQQIDKRQFIKRNMNFYCSNRMISVVNQLGDQLLTLPNEKKLLDDELQPVQIGQDNLMTISNIQLVQNNFQSLQNIKSVEDHKSTERSHKNRKKQVNKHNPQILTENLSKNQKKGQQASELHKLSIAKQFVDDREIDLIRKQKQKRVLEEKEQQMMKLNVKKFAKYTKGEVNFDYDGNIIEIKAEKKNNLVSKLVTPKLPSQQPKLKNQRQIVGKKTTYLQTFQIKDKEETGTSKKLKQRKQKMEVKQIKPEIYFSRIKDPIQNIQIKKGVKATFNQNIIQNKNVEISDQQLKKTKSNRKLSRRQYQRIKTNQLHTRTEENVKQYTQQLKISHPKENPRSAINSDERPFSSFKKRSVTQLQGQKVNVPDQKLKNFMLEKNRQTQYKNQPRKALDDVRPSSEIKKRQSLNRIDKYNLEYSRNKMPYQPPSKKTIDEEAVLPKIHLKSQYAHPKTREKLRDGSALRRQAAKKFQQILRV